MPDSVNVLMVDDELVVLEAFVDILEDEGYNMFTADGGEKAVEILQANPIDIVVTDINMPGMDGLQLLSKIHEMDPEIPVIMATAYSSIENTVESMKRGASNYLIKPIKVELLRSVLAEAATKRRMLRDNREYSDKIKKSNEQLKQLNTEREHVFEVIAQDLRQPLVDQINWCELLLSDGENSLKQHLESVAKLNSAASGMLTQVQDLLDAEKIEQRCQAIEEISAVEEPAAPAEIKASTPFDTFFNTEQRSDFKILLVEHSSLLRDLLLSVLRCNYHVFSAADGYEALSLLAEKPHLILTELNLPHVDGAEMLRLARQIAGDIPVVAMYDDDDKASLAKARSLGVQETLLKPFRIVDLVEKVETFAETRAAQIIHSVLVVSPNSKERQALYHLLDTRFQTQVAAGAEDAKEAVKNHLDLLIIDIADGEYSWEEVVTFIREQREDIKVLALSDKRDSAVAESLKELAVNSALLKPYSYDDLLSRVRDLLGIEEIDGYVLRSVYRRLA